jgi:hypothetical protein
MVSEKSIGSSDGPATSPSPGIRLPLAPDSARASLGKLRVPTIYGGVTNHGVASKVSSIDHWTNRPHSMEHCESRRFETSTRLLYIGLKYLAGVVEA